jgi:hypothetical protein
VADTKSAFDLWRVADHENLPSVGHEASAMVVTESDQVRWSLRRQPAA